MGCPQKNHNGPYGPSCAASTRSSAELANLRYGSYLENREEEDKNPQQQNEENGGQQTKNDNSEQQVVQEVEEESSRTEEEEEVQNDDDREEFNSDVLKEVLKWLSRQMDNLQTQVNDLAKRQEANRRSPE